MAYTRRNAPLTCKILITKNSCIDQFGVGYGKGETMVSQQTAEFFISKGFATLLKGEIRETDGVIPNLSPSPPEPPESPQEGSFTALQTLPDDLPAKDLLKAAGFEDVNEVSRLSYDELLEIQGIGESTAKKIGLYFSESA